MSKYFENLKYQIVTFISSLRGFQNRSKKWNLIMGWCRHHVSLMYFKVVIHCFRALYQENHIFYSTLLDNYPNWIISTVLDITRRACHAEHIKQAINQKIKFKPTHIFLLNRTTTINYMCIVKSLVLRVFCAYSH